MKKDVDGNQIRGYSLRVSQPQQKNKMKTATQTILETQTIPNTLDVIHHTKAQNQRPGQYLQICDLGNLIGLVAVGTARTIKFFVMYPASGLIDQCRLEHVYTAKRSTLCSRHIEHAIEYGTHEVRMTSYGSRFN